MYQGLSLKRSKTSSVLSPIFDPDILDHPLEWKCLFKNPGSVEVEIGSGKGTFLLARAAQLPDRSFVGIEYARAYLLTMAERAQKRGLSNVRVSRCEAAAFFRESIPAGSLSAFHLLYPDPWPKKRHHKRRLIQHAFLADLRRTLLPGAKLNLATDHEGYFEWMLEHFEAWKGTFVMQTRILDTERARRDFVGRSNYEIKYLKEGRTLYLLRGKRTGF